MKGLFCAVLALAAATPADAAHWTVDTAHSKLGFTVQWSKEPFAASFKSWKATIDFDPADLAHAKADVTVELASEASDEADFDDGLKSSLGFATAQFPAAHFIATGFTHKAGDAYVATGSLTLRGVTRPVTLPFTLTVAGKTAHMVGNASVVRTDFGVGQGMWAGDDPVAHAVTVTVDLTATRE
ncbi:MAG TPA: YceI family protein [Rhizomicrobium sp.]|nr:YceI family protein [Rhizomicrobium sp.]